MSNSHFKLYESDEFRLKVVEEEFIKEQTNLGDMLFVVHSQEYISGGKIMNYSCIY